MFLRITFAAGTSCRCSSKPSRRPARLLRSLRRAHGDRTFAEHARVRRRLQGLHRRRRRGDDVAEGRDAPHAHTVGRRRRAARARRQTRCSARTSTRSISTSAPRTSRCSRSNYWLGEPRRHREHVQPRARRGARRRHAARALAGERHRPHARRQGSQADRRVEPRRHARSRGSMPRRQGVKESGESSKELLHERVHRRRRRRRRRRLREARRRHQAVPRDEERRRLLDEHVDGRRRGDWINSTDYPRIAARPARFETLLGQVSPHSRRPSCSRRSPTRATTSRSTRRRAAARERRERRSKRSTASPTSSARPRARSTSSTAQLDDYVLGELDYTKSKTCCWNSSTSAMYDIIMKKAAADKAAADAAHVCTRAGRLQVAQPTATSTGRTTPRRSAGPPSGARTRTTKRATSTRDVLRRSYRDAVLLALVASPHDGDDDGCPADPRLDRRSRRALDWRRRDRVAPARQEPRAHDVRRR